MRRLRLPRDFSSIGLGTAATITNLAYPIGDALLLGLHRRGLRRAVRTAARRPWILLAIGMALNVFGDSSNLLQHSFGATRVRHSRSTPSPGPPPSSSCPWPCGSVTARQPADAASDRPASSCPTSAAAAALVILFAGTLLPVGRFAIALATMTLLAVGIRLVLSVRSLETLSQERHRQSVTDELTGLWNRRYLFRVLDAFFAEYDAEPGADRSLAFLFVDLDRFKEINDSFGHPAGDELLRQLGGRLQGSLRDGDLLVRLGGDEFAVVLVGGDADYATSVADRLTESLQRAVHARRRSVPPSARASASPWPRPTPPTAPGWCGAPTSPCTGPSSAMSPSRASSSNLDEEHDQMRLMEELHDGHRRATSWCSTTSRSSTCARGRSWPSRP